MNDQYRTTLTSKLSVEFLLSHIDNIDHLIDVVMDVRDTEIEQLQIRYDDLLSQRDAWWNFVGTERHAYSAMLRGMARRVHQVRADFQANDETNLADAQVLADENERLRAELATARSVALDVPHYQQQIDNLRAELDQSRRDDGNQIQHSVELSKMLRGMARRLGNWRRSSRRQLDTAMVSWLKAEGELVGLRERAIILPPDWREQLANEVSGTWLDEVTALVESWRTPCACHNWANDIRIGWPNDHHPNCDGTGQHKSGQPGSRY